VTLTFEQARAAVLRETSARRTLPATETIPTLEANGRVLAENIASDRDYPPFPRSARDGFAVRASDIPGTLEVVGEIRAGGEFFTGTVGAGQAVEIMTGAPMPAGADAVLMVEHAVRQSDRDGNRITTDKSHTPGDNFNARGIAAKEGEQVLTAGTRLTFTELAFLATVGRSTVEVYKKPRIAILPTGDEIVDVDQNPGPHQIRNSNAWSMAAQVMRAGGEAVLLPIARDNYESTRGLVKQGLESDMLLLSGGVSAGKYDIVEQVLADLGAEFFFTRVKVQPGQPLVFGHVSNGHVHDKLLFGLPGNPASTMVTLEVFARAAIDLISGSNEATLPILEARLTRNFRQKTGLTRFLPALVIEGPSVEPLSWQGSGDIIGMSRANAFLVTDPDRESWSAGDYIKVLLK
jgi:molybdopterin molybdotransferase